MAASTGDKITDIRNAARPVTTTVSSGRSAGGTSLVCVSLVGWPTASKVHFVTYKIDSNSNPVAGTQLDCQGIVSGSTINSFSVIDGSDTGNSVGDVVEMLPTAAWGQDLADALTSTHNRSGGLKSGLTIASPTITTPTLTVPVITDFTSANHTHASTAQGGAINITSLTNGAQTAYVATQESITSATYAALATASSVAVTIGANGLALVFISARIQDNTNNGEGWMSVVLSGANTLAAADKNAISLKSTGVNVPAIKVGGMFLLTGLSAGSTTFATQFRSAGADTAYFDYRSIGVVAL